MNFAIFTDNPPIREDVISAGLNRINTRYFTAIYDNISLIAVSNEKTIFCSEDLSPNLRDKIIFTTIPRYVVKILRGTDSFLGRVTGKYYDSLFQFQRNKFINSLKSSGSDALFVPLGADIKGYIRAITLAKLSGLPLAVWIGDDFENYARLSDNEIIVKLTADHLQRCFDATSKFFVISKGLQRHFKETYGLDSDVLSLPFHKQYHIELNTREDTVFFLGNASHFYHDGLIDMMDVICEYNEQNSRNVVMCFSIDNLPSIITNRHLKYIRSGQYKDDKDQSKAIAQSLFCIIPISFAEKYKGMVSTSFPSKLMECMAYAKKIIVYGPPYSSSVEYFKDNTLEKVIDVNNKSLLYDTLCAEMNHAEDLSGSYEAALRNNHGYEAIKKTFIEGLKSIEENR